MSVLSAHISLYSCGYGFCDSLERIIAFWGSTGVGIFFLILGFEWPSKRQKPLKQIIREYSAYYLAPVIFSGAVVYLSLVVRKGDAGISFLSFLIGNGSYLWFVPVFLLFKFIVRYELKRFFFLLIALIVFGVYLASEPVKLLGLNPHLNIFYWLPYLIVGKYSIGLIQSALKFLGLSSCIAAGAFLTLSPFAFCVLLSTLDLNYFSLETLFLNISFYSGLLLLLSSITNLQSKLAGNEIYRFLSDQTFFIYLWHMLFAGLVSRVVGHGLMVLIGPVVLVSMVFVLRLAIIKIGLVRLCLASGLKLYV